MKKLTFIFIVASIFLLLFGCSNNETESTSNTEENETKQNEEVQEDKVDNLIEKLTNYETIKLEEKNEMDEVTIEYPKFSYAPIDHILSIEMEARLESYKYDSSYETLDNFGLIDYRNRPYNHNITFEKPIITDKYVSIYFDNYHYMGQASVTPYANTFTFDLENERVVTIYDAMNEHETNLEIISEILAEKLIHDEQFAEYREDPVSDRYKKIVKEETLPSESNYSIFTLTNDSITIYNFYPSLFPNSAGIVGVEITWDEVEEYMNNRDENSVENIDDSKTEIIAEEHKGLKTEFGQSVEAETALKYVNQEYGFSLEVPESWKGQYLVQQIEDTNIGWMKEPSKIFAFSMVEDGKYMGDLFLLAVLEGISAEEVRESYPEGEFISYVGSGQDFVLVSSRPGELPYDLYEEPYVETGNKFGKMVGEVLPKVLVTLEIHSE